MLSVVWAFIGGVRSKALSATILGCLRSAHWLCRWVHLIHLRYVLACRNHRYFHLTLTCSELSVCLSDLILTRCVLTGSVLRERGLRVVSCLIVNTDLLGAKLLVLASDGEVRCRTIPSHGDIWGRLLLWISYDILSWFSVYKIHTVAMLVLECHSWGRLTILHSHSLAFLGHRSQWSDVSILIL